MARARCLFLRCIPGAASSTHGCSTPISHFTLGLGSELILVARLFRLSELFACDRRVGGNQLHEGLAY